MAEQHAFLLVIPITIAIHFVPDALASAVTQEIAIVTMSFLAIVTMAIVAMSFVAIATNAIVALVTSVASTV